MIIERLKQKNLTILQVLITTFLVVVFFDIKDVFNTFEKTIKDNENQLTRQLIVNDTPAIQQFIQQNYSTIFQHITVIYNSSPFFMYPTVEAPPSCFIKRKIALQRSGRNTGFIEVCTTSLSLFKNYLTSTHAVYLFGGIIFAFLIIRLWSIRSYKTEILEFIQLTKQNKSTNVSIKDPILQEFFEILKQQESEKIENEKNRSIAKTTATLAHDIRRPFTLVKAVLDSFELFSKDVNALNEARQDINQSIRLVQSMINDIMDFSREVELVTKPTPLEPVILFALNQVFQQKIEATISFHYDFKAQLLPLMDESRISRVFTNILGNALEAITQMAKKKEGTITIRSLDTKVNGINYVEISIANDGLPFTNGVEQRLFESFFTSGKNSGTGLGLASCKKIVTLHKGSIWAKNLPDDSGVAFTIRLLASNEIFCPTTPKLPHNSSEVWSTYQRSTNVQSSKQPLDDFHLNTSITILLLEDEALYKASIRRLISKHVEYSSKIFLLEANTVSEALQLVENEDVQFAIVDIDLNQSENGFDFLQRLQTLNISLPCLVHSNRTLEEFRQKATELGAKGFTPKPLSLDTLISFLNQNTPYVKNSLSEKLPCLQVMLFYCDDSLLSRQMFQYMVEDFNSSQKKFNLLTETFKNGEELLENLASKTANIVLTDQNMKLTGGILKGLDVIKQVKQLTPDTFAYLISNESADEMLPEVVACLGDGAFEPPWNILLLESILNDYFEKQSKRHTLINYI